MSQLVKPVAPSINDVRTQIRKSIEDAIQKAKDEKQKTEREKQDHADELDRRMTRLTTELGKTSDVAKKKALILGHQNFVVEHHDRGARQEYEEKLKEYQREITQLEKDLESSASADLGD